MEEFINLVSNNSFYRKHRELIIQFSRVAFISVLAGVFIGTVFFHNNEIKFFATDDQPENNSSQSSGAETPQPETSAPSAGASTNSSPSNSNVSPPATKSPPSSSFDCAAFNNSQRSILVQAGDSYYRIYLSMKSQILGPGYEYADSATDAQKQSIVEGEYIKYQTNMDIVNSKYLQNLSGVGNDCYKYYQAIPYASR